MSPYEVLGVKRDATQAEIKKAYRQLALEHHPDQNQGDEKAAERFKSVAQAYAKVGTPQARAAYDVNPFDLIEVLAEVFRT